MWRILFLLAIFSPIQLAYAAPSFDTLIYTGIVKGMMTRTLLDVDDHRPFQLENIRPLTEGAFDNLVLNKKLRFYSANEPSTDRYGIPEVQAVRDDDGVWIQQEIVSKGLALVYSTPMNGKTALLLYPAEASARTQKLGLWSDPNVIKTPENIHRFKDGFQIVQGKISNVAVKKEYTYINFGADWKEDFTINVRNKIWKALKDQPQNGQTVRIRGWIQWRNGPMIELTHPEQMEMIHEQPASPVTKPNPAKAP